MARPIRRLAELLAPLAAQAFFQQIWESQPLHLRRSDPAFYDLLLTNRDVDAAISSGGLRYPGIQLAKGGAFFPAEAFTRTMRAGDDLFTGIPDLDRVRAEYQAGATISLPGFHRSWAPLRTLTAALEEETDHVVHANVYATPGNAAGFAPHYDTHEVFVLQIAGAKRWRIHEPPLVRPHRSQAFDPRARVSDAPILDIELAAGDLLYLPRGFVHSTTTSDRFSVHVTLGMTVFTWVELLAEWAQASRHHAELRRALPPGFAGRDEARRFLKDQLPRILTELQQATDADLLVEGFARRIRSARAGRHAEFQTAIMANDARSADPQV